MLLTLELDVLDWLDSLEMLDELLALDCEDELVELELVLMLDELISVQRWSMNHSLSSMKIPESST